MPTGPIRAFFGSAIVGGNIDAKSWLESLGILPSIAGRFAGAPPAFLSFVQELEFVYYEVHIVRTDLLK
jgi:hypothetical protein